MSRMWTIPALIGVMSVSAVAVAQDGPPPPSEAVLANASGMSFALNSRAEVLPTDRTATSAAAGASDADAEDESGSGRESKMRRALALLYLTLGSGCKDSVCPAGHSR